MSIISLKKRKNELGESNELNNFEENLIEKLNKININTDSVKFKKIEEKIINIETKLETVEKIYAKLDSIYNLIEKKLTEKDYVIENLTNENIELKKDLIESIMTNEKDKEKENIYFY